MNQLDDLPELLLGIDDHELVAEWQRQPQLMQTWTAYHADAILAMDAAKATMEVTKATQSREIRQEPMEFDLTKTSDPAVAACVLEQPIVKMKIKAYHEAKHRVAILAGAVASIEDRRRALQKIVDLHGQDYYREPPTPAGLRGGK